jgi:MFS family permease
MRFSNAALTVQRQAFSAERILWLTGLGIAISMLGDIALYVVLPTHTAQAGIALADVGLMLSANRAIRIFINSPYGVLIERLPRRWVMLFSIFIGTISTLLYTVPSFWPLLVGRLLWGIAWSGVWMGGSNMALDIANHTNRGRFVGRLQMWGFIGQGVSALISGILTDWLGYTSAFYVFAAASLVMGVAWLLWLPETRREQTSRAEMIPPPLEPLPIPEEIILEEAAKHPAKRSRASLVLATVIMALNWLIFLGAMGATLSLLLQERVGSSVMIASLLIPLATFTGTLSAGTQVLGVLTAPLSGRLSDRSGSRWALVVLALVLGAVALLITKDGVGITIVLAVLLTGIVTSILQTQAVTVAGDYARANQQGRIIGILNTAGDIGSAAGPYLAFLVLPLIGLEGIFTLMAALVLLALPWVMWMAWRERAISR